MYPTHKIRLESNRIFRPSKGLFDNTMNIKHHGSAVVQTSQHLITDITTHRTSHGSLVLANSTRDFRSQVQFLAMTLPGYFWDKWPYFASKLRWHIITIEVNSALHPSRVATLSTSFGWRKGGKVTSVEWQVTLCDSIWHVISCSSAVISIINCYDQFTLLYLLTNKGRVAVLTRLTT